MAMSQQKAISATVTGDDQEVGFRAMVMKQAPTFVSSAKALRRFRFAHPAAFCLSTRFRYPKD
jgi:hypothetical protein